MGWAATGVALNCTITTRATVDSKRTTGEQTLMTLLNSDALTFYYVKYQPETALGIDSRGSPVL